MTKYRQATQLVRRVKDPLVRKAFCCVDRSCFVPFCLKSRVWSDRPLPIDDGATISQPSLVAEMTEWLAIHPQHHVLEIGTGSGYQTAILAELAKSVFTIEISEVLSTKAQQRLRQLNYSNIQFKIGDGRIGWPKAAPFDRIISTVAFPDTPEPLLEQLSDYGICLAPIGPAGDTQWLTLYSKQDGSVSEKRLIPVRFLSLR